MPDSEEVNSDEFSFQANVPLLLPTGAYSHDEIIYGGSSPTSREEEDSDKFCGNSIRVLQGQIKKMR